MTTADERVERVGCMVRRSEMEEGLLIIHCVHTKTNPMLFKIFHHNIKIVLTLHLTPE